MNKTLVRSPAKRSFATLARAKASSALSGIAVSTSSTTQMVFLASIRVSQSRI